MLQITQKQFNIAYEQLLDDADREYETSLDGTKLKPNVESFCYGMKAKVIDHFSQVIVIASMTQNGMGKSSLLYKMGKVIDKDKFNFERNFHFSGGLKEIEKSTNNLTIGSIL